MESLARRRAGLFLVLSMLVGCRTLPSAERSNLEYRMLMEYEHQKLRLQRSAPEPEALADLYVVQTRDVRGLRDVCERHGFTFIRRVFEDENYYLFRRHGRGTRPRRQLDRAVGRRSQVQWASRQSLRERVQRAWPADADQRRLPARVDGLPDREAEPRRPTLAFNDPLFREQWYLHSQGKNGSSPKNDINVLPVWQMGVTGKGVAISVLDDGVHALSEEVAANYDSASSDEYLFRKTGLHPIPENSHGTRCAAIAAGVANNSVCGVGVAYEAKVGGVRILDGPLTDVQEALALVHALHRVDVYTASWGPSDGGQAVDGPEILARLAFVKGVTMGRQGRGSIYVWAAGNGGAYRDNCSLDGYASSPFTLTIGALTRDGRSTSYSEPCPAVIAATYVGDDGDEDQVKVVVPEGRGKCKETFQGTSAAAPMAAGVVALALQANPDLTWRDVQHLIVRTSRVPSPPERGWLTNAAGLRFHPRMGSGVLDAHALVALAASWRPVGGLRVWTTTPHRRSRLLPARSRTSVPLRILKRSMAPGRRVDRLETVVATLSVRHGRRGRLALTLVSPGGTPSPLLTRRPRDNATSGFEHWDFASLHFWGEDPEGVWTLKVANHDPEIDGFLDYASITLHGTGRQ